MRKKLIGILSLILVAIIGIGVYDTFFVRKETKVIKRENTGSKYKVPLLAPYYGKDKLGDIDGYVMKMKEEYVRDVIVPVSEDRKTLFKIKYRDNVIKSIRYEVESTNQLRLIDSGNIEKINKNKKEASFNFNASAVMEQGKEYFLKFIIETDKYKEIYYYTRVIVSDREFVTKQIAFAKKFSDATTSDTESKKLMGYLEPDISKKDNDNLGITNIHSNYDMLTWNEMSVKKVTKTEVTAKEFCIKDSGEAGTYTLCYQFEAKNGEKNVERFNVAETITVWTFNGKEFILAYDREVNQVWEPIEDNVGNAFIDFGIQNTDNIDYLESDNGKYIAYQINGDAYVMDIEQRELRCVYKLNAKNSETLLKVRARMVSIKDNGNVDFMIYGYSPSNEHIGKSGISIFSYDYKSNESYEKAFIPCQEQAATLESQFSKLCFLGDGTLYIMLDNTIYFANLKTLEWGNVSKKLDDDAYAINTRKDMIAYNESGKGEGSDKIKIIDLKGNKEKVIKDENGQQVKVFGYTGENLVYGILSDDNKVKKLKIVDTNLKEVKSYMVDKGYIKDVEISDNIINIKRAKDNGADRSDDQLLDNTESKDPVAKSSYYTDDIKMKELALSFTNNLNSSRKLKVVKDALVVFDGKTEIKANLDNNKKNSYFVYGYGRLQGKFQNQKEALKKARECYGLVAKDGQKIWTIEEHYNK